MRALDDHGLAGATASGTTRVGAPGLPGAARTDAQPGTKDLARHRAEPARRRVEENDLGGQDTRGAQRSRFTSLPLWAAHGWKHGPPPERAEEVALIEWPESEPTPTRYRLARLPRQPALRKLVATAKARWRVEQAYRELKDAPGLGHFEGRFWQGFHHHVALVTAAFVFLRQAQARLRRRAQRKRLPPPTRPQVRRSLRSAFIHLRGRCPWCHIRFQLPDSI